MAALNDSKKLTARRRAPLAERIRAEGLFALVSLEAAEVDRQGIHQATLSAMAGTAQMVLEQLRRYPERAGRNCDLKVDGIHLPLVLSGVAEAVKGGDGLVSEISAASILAKETRDEEMRRRHREFPVYDWHRNVGYGSRKHFDAIEQAGITPHHRLTFLRRRFGNRFSGR